MQFSNKDHNRNIVASSANLFQKNDKTEECRETDDVGKNMMENCSSHGEEVDIKLSNRQ